MNELEQYLRENWEDYKRFPNTPEHTAFGDALYLLGKQKRSEWPNNTFPIIDGLKTNRDRVKRSKGVYDREFKKELVIWYQIIIDKAEGINK